MSQEARALIRRKVELFELREEIEQRILYYYKCDNDMAHYAAEELLKIWEEVNAELHRKISIQVK